MLLKNKRTNMHDEIIHDLCPIKITLHTTFSLMHKSSCDYHAPIPLYSLVDNYGYGYGYNYSYEYYDDHCNDDDKFVIVEYGNLPSPVQDEVIEYLGSDDFILSDNIKDYVLSDITHSYDNNGNSGNSSDNIHDITCKAWYPSYNIIITNVDLRVKNKQLFVILDGKLKLTPLDIVIKQKNIPPSSVCNKQVTTRDVRESLEDGFHEITHDGPLITEYGNHLGEDDGRYMLYFDYHGITVDI